MREFLRFTFVRLTARVGSSDIALAIPARIALSAWRPVFVARRVVVGRLLGVRSQRHVLAVRPAIFASPW